MTLYAKGCPRILNCRLGKKKRICVMLLFLLIVLLIFESSGYYSRRTYFNANLGYHFDLPGIKNTSTGSVIKLLKSSVKHLPFQNLTNESVNKRSKTSSKSTYVNDSAGRVVEDLTFNNVHDVTNRNVITLKEQTRRFLPYGNDTKIVTIDAPYLLENKELCSGADDLTVVIMVHTAPKNFDKREAIRKTWGNNSYYSDLGTVRTLFLLGEVSNTSLQAKIEQEFRKFGDIVQGSFVDSYYNMTLKGVMGYKWLKERCKNAKIILKVDDDVIVNMFTFLKEFAPNFLSKPNHMACRRLHNSQVQRRKGSKWYVDKEQFKGSSVYPDFCQGFMVAISNDVISDLYYSASLTPFFWIDDIYLYGLVPGNIPRMQYSYLGYGTTVIWGAEKGISCYKKKKCQYLVILIWTDVPRRMEELWSLMVQQHAT